jgi:hypothetical protein
MNKIMPLLAFFSILITSILSYAKEIDYSNCGTIHEVIAREAQEISNTPPADHDELAQLYTSRGESYLLSAQYEKAAEDFQHASSLLGYCHNMDNALMIAFRVAFGEVVSYDNLGMAKQAQQALDKLKTITMHIGCHDCIEHHPCQEMASPSANRLHFSNTIRHSVNTLNLRNKALPCKQKKDKQPEKSQPQQESQDNYSDILGPNQLPEPGWCEEVVVGTATLMEGIALLAPNWAIKTSLIAVLEAFKQRALKCCQAGGFWKACVAPLVRKWKQWKDNTEKGVFPNTNSLSLYIS